MSVMVCVAIACVLGTGRAAADQLKLEDALDLLTRSSGHTFEIRPAAASGRQVVPLPPDVPLDRALSGLLRGVNYTIFRSGGKHLVIQILGDSLSGSDLPLHRATPGAGVQSTRHWEPKSSRPDPGEVELIGPDGVQERVDLDGHGDQDKSANANWVSRTGPEGVEELIHVPHADQDTGVDEEPWEELVGPGGVPELVRPADHAVGNGQGVD